MKNMGRMAILVCLVSLLYPMGAVVGQEKGFPTGPINLYVGYPPGGGMSNCALFMAEVMKKYLNQPVIVNHKPGAVQAIAADFVSKSKPDGYTILYITSSEIIVKLLMEGSDLKFSLDSFDSLGAGQYTVFTLGVKSDSPWKTIEDFVEFGRKSPRSLSIGNHGPGSAAHICAELLSGKAGIDVKQIPFQGTGPAVTGLLGGHVSAHIASFGSFGEYLQPGGGIRALASFDNERHPSFPDVPTLQEKGYEITIFKHIMGFHAPKGLPDKVKATLVQAIEKTVKDPQVVSFLTKAGYVAKYTSPELMDKINHADYKNYQEFLTKLGLVKK